MDRIPESAGKPEKETGVSRKKDSAGRQCRREDFWQPEPAVWQPERWGLGGLSF